jgi:hypothetical protein
VLIRIALAAALALGAARAEPARPTEAEVRAAYLFNFARFVEWPDAAARADLIICVRDDAAVLAALQPAAGQSVGTRRVEVRDVTDDDTGCDVIYLSSRAARVMAPPRLGVLAVGADPAALGRGAVFVLVVQSGRLRFRVDREAAQHAGLRIPPNVLNLAVE